MTHPMQSRAWQALAAIGLGLALLTTGCGDDAPEPSRLGKNEDKPSAPATATPTSTPTPTSTTTKTAAPAADREEELYDATVHFYEVINKAFRTLDVTPIEDVVVDNSGAARGYVDYINTVKSKGHRFDIHGPYRITDFDHKVDGNDQAETATFTLSDKGGAEVDARGKIVEDIEPGSSSATIQFIREGEKWLVVSQRLD